MNLITWESCPIPTFIQKLNTAGWLLFSPCGFTSRRLCRVQLWKILSTNKWNHEQHVHTVGGHFVNSKWTHIPPFLQVPTFNQYVSVHHIFNSYSIIELDNMDTLCLFCRGQLWKMSFTSTWKKSWLTCGRRTQIGLDDKFSQKPGSCLGPTNCISKYDRFSTCVSLNLLLMDTHSEFTHAYMFGCFHPSRSWHLRWKTHPVRLNSIKNMNASDRSRRRVTKADIAVAEATT
jgi:hypothetical protein